MKCCVAHGQFWCFRHECMQERQRLLKVRRAIARSHRPPGDSGGEAGAPRIHGAMFGPVIEPPDPAD